MTFPPAILAVVRFALFLVLLSGLIAGLTYLFSQFGLGDTGPVAFAARSQYWYFNPIIWAWLIVSAFFAGFLDYPRFRIWHRMDRALIAGFTTAILPPILMGLTVLIHHGRLVSPLMYATPYEFCCGGGTTYFRVAMHYLAGCVVCGFPWFMPNGPPLLPFGFLYRFVLLGFFIVALFIIVTVVTLGM